VSGAGLGMGNASRLAAILEALSKMDCEINVKIYEWGAGHQFLKNFLKNPTSVELRELHSYNMKQGLWGFIKTYLKNSKELFLAIKNEEPDLLLLDSDYHFPAYLFYKKPKIYIGQASDVLERALTHQYKPQSFFERINFIIREKADALFQQVISTIVLVPVFTTTKQSKSHFKKIPLIVREEFLTTPLDNTAQSTGILLSGSQINKEFFLNLKDRYQLPIISPSSENSSELTRAKTLDAFDVVITQGGLTSISEVLSRGKKLIVVPIKNHPEQILNAIEIESLGLGIKVEQEDLTDLDTIIKNLKTTSTQIDCTGAQKAAEIIVEYLISSSQIQ
jgi:predicted glycosyltransferase